MREIEQFLAANTVREMAHWNVGVRRAISWYVREVVVNRPPPKTTIFPPRTRG